MQLLMQDITCADNEVCELVVVQCFRAPCPPLPQCIPRSSGRHQSRIPLQLLYIRSVLLLCLELHIAEVKIIRELIFCLNF